MHGTSRNFRTVTDDGIHSPPGDPATLTAEPSVHRGRRVEPRTSIPIFGIRGIIRFRRRRAQNYELLLRRPSYLRNIPPSRRRFALVRTDASPPPATALGPPSPHTPVPRCGESAHERCRPSSSALGLRRKGEDDRRRAPGRPEERRKIPYL